MNFTESFDQFSSSLSGMDIALYAGVGLAMWVIFKDKLSPVQKILGGLLSNIKVPSLPSLPSVVSPVPAVSEKSEDLFFKLVQSWKQTRDLAVQSGCEEAVKVADSMFPYLSPTGCPNKKDIVS